MARRVGRYVLLEQLAFGGMATVHIGKLCAEGGFSRVIAAKRLRDDRAADREFRAMFLDEARLVARIRHANVVSTLDIVTEDRELLLVMEYVHGPTLGHVARSLREHGEAIPLRFAASIMCDALDGLHAAHEARSELGESLQIIHRDVSPQNILLGADGIARVADFGVAHATDRLQRTVAGHVKGNPAFMAPEQTRGERLDRRADVYAAAAVLWELVAGEPLFSESTPVVAMLRHAEEAPVPPSTKRADLPPELDAIVLRGLAKDADARFASAREMSEALEAAVGRASHAEVGAWLARVEHDFFAARDRLLANVERTDASTVTSDRPTVPTAVTRGRRSWRGRAVAGGLAIVAAAVVIVASRPEAPAAAPSRPAPPIPKGTRAVPIKLLVPEFANRTGDPILEPGLVTVLREVLNDSSEVIASFQERSETAARTLVPTWPIDEATWIRVGATLDAPAVVLGSIARDGAGYVVAVRVVEPTSNTVWLTRKVPAATADAAVGAVAELALAVRDLFGDTSTPEQRARSVASFHTTAAAASAYGRAGEAIHTGSWDAALREANAAAAADPSFAMAQFALGLAYANAGRFEDAERACHIVLSASDRVSDANRMTASAVYFSARGEPAKAVEQLSDYVAHYPTNLGGLMDLANAYVAERDMASAERDGRRAYELSHAPVALANLALYASYAGNFDDAVRAAREALPSGGGIAGTASVALAHAELGLDRLDDASAAYDAFAKQGATAASRAALGQADLAIGEGRLRDAEPLLRAAIAADLKVNSADLAHVKQAVLAETHFRMGLRTQALSEADELAAMEDLSVLVPIARLYAAAGDARRTNVAAERLRGRIDPDARSYAELVVGELQLEQGQPAHALERFEAAQRLSDTWLVRFDLGRVYLALAQFPEAALELDTCIQRHGEALALFLDDAPTFRYWPEALYLRARALEGLDSKDARAVFRAFAELKHRSDPDRDVTDARRHADAP